jgi:hypothetical protein
MKPDSPQSTKRSGWQQPIKRVCNHTGGKSLNTHTRFLGAGPIRYTVQEYNLIDHATVFPWGSNPILSDLRMREIRFSELNFRGGANPIPPLGQNPYVHDQTKRGFPTRY